MIKNKKILIMISLIIAFMLLIPNKSKAGLQANKGGTSLGNVIPDSFFEGIRKMETQYGTLGKNANLDSKYLDTTKNGIDAHMALNTEWGTVALLTDSVFGVGTSISGTSDKTSTGNESGVYNLANGKYECVASTYNGTSNIYNKKIRSADERYFNSYSSNTSIPGDALQCANWLLGSAGSWISSSSPIFKRGYGALFGFSYGNGDSSANSSFGSRAVVVCGTGL